MVFGRSSVYKYIAVAIRPAAGRDLIALFVRHILFAWKYTEISIFNEFRI